MIAQALQGKRALIVGGVGEHSIGRAVTRAVAASGAAGVAITARSQARCDEAAAEIAGENCRAVGIAGDVRNGEDIDRVVIGAAGQLGGLDLLITVVGGIHGYASANPLHETSDSDWDATFDVNVRYVFRYCRAAIRRFLDQGHGGTIVSVGSTSALRGMPCAAPYGAAKAALSSLGRTVGAEYARRGIRMNVLNCGAVATTTAAAGIKQGVKLDKIPMGRPGLPGEVADAVVFLASPLSHYMTGQSVNFDGGISVRYPLPIPKTDESMAG